MPELAMVIYPNGSRWYWRIEMDGKTIEDCRLAYGTLSACVAAARHAHIIHMADMVAERG